MRFLLYERVNDPLASFLRAKGFDTLTLAHDYPSALNTIEVLGIATAEERILLTNDQDFGEFICRHHLPHAGVILFRLMYEDIEIKRH